MASLYARKNSPYWWVKFTDDSGRTRQESTKLLRNDPAQTREAKLELAKRTQRELERGSQRSPTLALWVPDYLQARYATSPKTLERYHQMWAHWASFLTEHRITAAKQITYDLCLAFLRHRTKQGAHHNTGLSELAFLGLVMREAIRRGYATTNPVAQVRVPRVPPPEKPEITEHDLKRIWNGLKERPAWMQRAFFIGLHTGCRLRETSFPLTNVDFVNAQIYFSNPKGGRNRGYSVPIAPELLEYLRKIKEAGETVSVELPSRPSHRWRDFFRDLGMPQYCFHCLRVTFITRGARAGVPERLMRRLVNHASVLAHRIYQRVGSDELTAAVAQIAMPSMGRTPDR